MTREEAILCIKGVKNYGRDTFTEQTDWQESLDLAIEIMQKYQKIEQIIDDWINEDSVGMSDYWMGKIKEVLEDDSN